MRRIVSLLPFLASLLVFGTTHELIVKSFEKETIELALKPIYTPVEQAKAYLFTQTGHRIVKQRGEDSFIFDVSRTDWIIVEAFGKNSAGYPMRGSNPSFVTLSVYRQEPQIFLFTDPEKYVLYVGIKLPQSWQFIDCEFQNLRFKRFTFNDILYLYTSEKPKDGIHTLTLNFQLPYGLKKTLKLDVFVFHGLVNLLRGSKAPMKVEPVPPYNHVVKPGETLWSIANMYGLRIADLELANGIEDGSFIVSGTVLKLARVHFDASLTSLVINISTGRLALYYNGVLVKVFPVAVGRSDTTPPGTYWIMKKEIDPALYWFGEYIPPRSPINGLGTRFFQLSNPTYGIHGTTKPWEIGKRISHGCIRMFNQDIETIDAFVDVGTKVVVVRNTEEFPTRWAF
ncbi:L,D-transpeptidase family protein [Pseudothermotoga sp.]|uniref:L,D-transpeptidase family protein n=1 Tax=Pseudothermotoga sp. TaxID=2033661 RepID=UPI0031F70E90